MQAINNSGLLTICNVCGLTGFAPAIEYVYDAAAKTILVTDDSDFGAGDDLKIIHVRVTDAEGGIMSDSSIVVAGGNHTFDVSGLNPIEGFTITATIVTNLRNVGDGAAYRVGAGAPASSNLSYWNKTQQ